MTTETPATGNLVKLRVRDGSLLDREAMALLAEMARENNYQVWVLMVDGEVAA